MAPVSATAVPRLDHLVVAAATLEEGVAHLEQRLGVVMEAGGRHERYGTHNALLGLGGDAYLEVIAVDPDAAPPAVPRWFGLDEVSVRERLRRGPTVIHWVVAVHSLGDVPDDELALHGGAVELSRGDNRWALTVPADGHLPMDGVLPSLIEWHTEPPGRRLPDRGLRLARLTLDTPDPEALVERLRRVGLTEVAEVVGAQSPSLQAVVHCARGPVTL